MQVSQLWRFPVKSMSGERLDEVDVGRLGLDGDRRYGLIDLDTGLVLTARRVPELLFAVPTVNDGSVSIRIPDGRVLSGSDAISAWLGRPVELRVASDGVVGRYENPTNDEDPDAEWSEWEGPAGVFHDSARTRVSVLGEVSIGEWDVRRFRANVVLSGGDERELLGRKIRVGTVTLSVTKEISRCVMVTRPQPGLERDKTVLQQLSRTRGGHMGIGTVVDAPGTIRLGDPVVILA